MSNGLGGVPEPGDIVAQRYELTRRIGSGAAGVVFEAAHTHIGRRVALKWLYPHLAAEKVTAKRFFNEARAACLIDHPNVIEVFDAGPDRDSFFLVMELLEGEPLSARIDRGAIAPAELLDLLLPALKGMGAAHKAGIIHRDLKPENIFLAKPRNDRPGGTKVLDFGISKLRENQEQLTNAGTFVGSPFYMAPEQIADASTVDARVDIYALGVILYEGLSGDLPFESESLTDLFFKVTRDQPQPLQERAPDLPEGLPEVVHRAMASSPDERFATVGELEEALSAYAGAGRFVEGEDRYPPFGDLETVGGETSIAELAFQHRPILDGGATIAESGPFFDRDPTESLSTALEGEATQAMSSIFLHDETHDAHADPAERRTEPPMPMASPPRPSHAASTAPPPPPVDPPSSAPGSTPSPTPAQEMAPPPAPPAALAPPSNSGPQRQLSAQTSGLPELPFPAWAGLTALGLLAVIMLSTALLVMFIGW